jgi:hypothetical protein
LQPPEKNIVHNGFTAPRDRTPSKSGSTVHQPIEEKPGASWRILARGRPGRQTSLILGEDKPGERKFRVDQLKHLTADLTHRDIENLADSL